LSVVALVGVLAPTAGASSGATSPASPTPPSGDAPAFDGHGHIDVPTGSTGLVKCSDQRALGTTVWTIDGVTPGRVFALTADDATYRNDFDIRFFSSQAACDAGTSPLAFRNHAGNENSVVPSSATVALVTLNTGTPGAAFTYQELADEPATPVGRPGVTVVAVIEGFGHGNGFSPYHDDFLGSYHPWNTDADPSNDIDFNTDPSAYIPGYPGATPLHLKLPQHETDDVAALESGDSSIWDTMQPSEVVNPQMYWFPGTKVVGALGFGLKGIQGPTTSHATRSASVAAGNIHGSCPECVFVLLGGDSPLSALAWATAQPWIDVITNSYETSDIAVHPSNRFGIAPPDHRDGVYFGPEGPYTKAATESGQTIVWAAGNGVANSLGDVPESTYYSSQKGPDWIVTVGAIAQGSDQPFRSSGKPVDIAAYGDDYPAAGMVTSQGQEPANGKGTHSGTSNATPVVAGTFAEVIQQGRELLGDPSPGHADGVVASGTAMPCPPSPNPCPLGDGTLTRAEVQSIVFDNVAPTTIRLTGTPLDTLQPPMEPLPVATESTTDSKTGLTLTEPNYFLTGPAVATYVSEGHGLVYGRADPARFVAEQRRFRDALRGDLTPYQRPPGETAWMAVDSKCRQRLWGEWDGGYDTHTDPAFSIPDDDLAATWNAWCSAMPQDAFQNGLPGNF
jgi:hypothetical protein